jgi:DsbC/DsbD-like thiol-disulfide interchange protein
MRIALLLAMSAAASSFCCGGAFAASSPWVNVEGGRVRLVTSGVPDAAGRLYGALEVQLAPGWKTYWRDPGASGVPPTIDVSASRNIKSAELDFPAPERHDRGNFSWAGYSRPVNLPVTFQFDTTDKPATVDATIFLGICETVCVPVKASLVLDPTGDPDNPEDVAVVASARAALPAKAHPGFGIRTVGLEAGKLVVEATFPGDAKGADLFLAADGDYTFEEPERTEKDGRTFFTMNATRPGTPPAGGQGLHYTLVTEGGAVSGILPYF